MSEVIGYKGTPLERAENWLTLLALRKSIKKIKERGLTTPFAKKIFERENTNHHKIFNDYVRAA